jgi:isopentenyl diphosphate isomerase/L-lactate dehydrogenase-like FMN-dependent dehydrogenase
VRDLSALPVLVKGVMTGEDAVLRALELLGAEFANAMGLLGVTNVKELNRAHVVKQEPPQGSEVR